MKPFKLDQLDLDIIELVEENCSLTYNEVADKTGKNLWTVRDRMILLRQREIIKACRAEIDYGKLGLGCKAMIGFNVPPERIDEFVASVKKGEAHKEIYDYNRFPKIPYPDGRGGMQRGQKLCQKNTP